MIVPSTTPLEISFIPYFRMQYLDKWEVSMHIPTKAEGLKIAYSKLLVATKLIHTSGVYCKHETYIHANVTNSIF